MKRFSIFFSLLIFAPLFALGASEKKDAGLPPIDTVRAFFNALADGDKTKIKALALPNAKLKTLYATPPTKDEQDALRLVAKDNFRILRPGETLPMEGGVLTVPLSNNLVFVYADGMQYPFPVSRVDGIWKVNAGPIISAREKTPGTSAPTDSKK